MNLIDVNEKFATDEQCLAYLEQMRWPDGVYAALYAAATVSARLRGKLAERTSALRFTSA